MGTRSVVATLYHTVKGDVVKGRYVHWDGYPSGVGLEVFRLVQRDGLDTVDFTLLDEHYGWSSLDSTTAEDAVLEPGMDDGRFVLVPGYGVAYTTEQGQSSPDEWIAPGDDSWCDYAYIMTPDGLVLCDIVGLDWMILDTIPWSATPAEAKDIVARAGQRAMASSGFVKVPYTVEAQSPAR